jgi:hypothetical protein
VFIWSTIHGLSSILRSQAVDTLGLGDEVLEAAIPETLARIGQALEGDPTGSEGAEACPGD